MHAPLPPAWVDALFSKLALTYGRDFLSRWEGLDMQEVKNDWARELAGFKGRPEAIKHGLSCLPPSKPPTVLEFAALCRNAPVAAVPALPAPTPDAAVVQAAVSKALKVAPEHDPKAWAKRLIGRAEAGEKIPVAHLRMAKDALGLESAYREAT